MNPAAFALPVRSPWWPTVALLAAAVAAFGMAAAPAVSAALSRSAPGDGLALANHVTAELRSGLPSLSAGLSNLPDDRDETHGVSTFRLDASWRGAEKQTYRGTLVAAPEGLPTTVILNASGTLYAIKIDSETTVLNIRWAKMPLSHLEAGATLEIYGVPEAGGEDGGVRALVIHDRSTR